MDGNYRNSGANLGIDAKRETCWKLHTSSPVSLNAQP